jgi:hypothetical protein
MRKYIISIILIAFIMFSIFSQSQKEKTNFLFNIENPIHFNLNEQADVDIHSTDDKVNETCRINAGTIKIGKQKVENGITYIYSEENDKIIYTKTVDKKFKTAEGLSIENPIIEFLKIYGTNIQFEVGTCMYLELSDGWKACLSYDYTLDFLGHVLYFYKIDENFSRHMNLVDYLDFMQY